MAQLSSSPMSAPPAPTVSVGIPAYDRPRELERAVRSVLAQSHGDLEVIDSDDASPDRETERVGSDLAAGDPRVRFTRQPRNLGHARNYEWVLEAARGDHFMWLSDDDWIDPDYVARCLAVLRSEPGVRLVCGLARYYRDGDHVIDERPIDLESRRPGVRLVRYFGRVNMNGPLFGLVRRDDMLAVPFPDVVGGDWMLVAGLAARGRIRTLGDVHVHRSMAGLGGSARRLAESFGMRGLAARQHHVAVAARLWAAIARRDPAFAILPAPARLATATLAALLVLVRFPGHALLRSGLRAVGAGHLEDRAIAWVRARDRARAAAQVRAVSSRARARARRTGP
jgi:hypothetical protein